MPSDTYSRPRAHATLKFDQQQTSPLTGGNRKQTMVRLEQPKIFSNSPGMQLEIEALPLANPGQRCVDLRLRGISGERLIFELDTSIYPGILDAPLDWIESGISTRRDHLSEKFGSPVIGNQIICIQQNRIPREDFIEIQQQLGDDSYTYPFDYDLELLVNPDPQSIQGAGFGLHFSGLSYAELTRFLVELRTEVRQIWSGEIACLCNKKHVVY